MKKHYHISKIKRKDGSTRYYVQFRFKYLERDICKTFRTLSEALRFRGEIARMLLYWKETGKTTYLPVKMKEWHDLIPYEINTRWDRLEEFRKY